MTSKRPARRSDDDVVDDRPVPAIRYSTIIIANVAKLIGLGIAINEMVIRTEARNSVIAFCALCILGTQAAEDAFLRLIDKMFSQGGE